MLQLTRGGYRSPDYWDTVNELAERIQTAAESSPLAALTERPDWNTIKPFFPINDNSVLTDNYKYGPQRAPRNARFIWIVGTRAELFGFRDLNPYDQDSIAEEWRPFTPETDDPGRLIATDAARAAGLTYAVVENDDLHKLGQLIQDFSNQFVPVVVIVDAWTLSIERYRNVVNFFDKENFVNCTVVVPWNMLDADTANRTPDLERNLEVTFPIQYHKPDTYIKFRQSKNLRLFKKEVQISLVRYVGDVTRSLKAARALPEAAAFAQFPQLTAVGR